MFYEHNSGAPTVVADARSSGRTSDNLSVSTNLGLYQAAWRKVRNSFFDIERLQNWDRWEHRYDKELRRGGDVIKYTNRMLRSLKDEYTWLRSPEEVAGDSALHEGDSLSGVGMLFSKNADGVTVRSVFAGCPGEKAGLKPRDVITHIDGLSVQEMSEELVNRRLRGNGGTAVHLTFMRAGHSWECQVVREVLSTPAVHTDVLPNGIGYLKLESFQQWTTVSQVRSALKHKLRTCKSLVLDLRGNSGGYIEFALETAALFLQDAVLVSITERVDGADRHLTTAHYCGKLRNVAQPVVPPDKWQRCRRRCMVPASVPLVVLVDNDTASAGEILTGALKDNGRGIVIGMRTFGKGIGQTTYKMPCATDVQVTSLHYRTPSGVWPGDAQRKRNRIRPNIVVKGNGRFLSGGLEADVQLQYACDLLLGKRKARVRKSG